jgi:hypothetical protein
VRGNSRSIAALVLVLPLAACNGMRLTDPAVKTTVEVVNTTSYPELPDIQPPQQPVLIPWEYDVPRDMSRFEPKNEECRKTPEAKRDEEWDKRCGVNPVIRDSNVLYGFDQRNWNLMLENFAKLREYIVQLQARLDLANKSRQEWRAKAEEERKNAAKAGVGAPAAAATAAAPAASAPLK